jgi:hypothetical protein
LTAWFSRSHSVASLNCGEEFAAVAHPLLFVPFDIWFKRKEALMKNYILLLALTAVTQSSCAFVGGAATGAVAAGAGYEIQAKRQMDRLDEDFKNRRISREEYEDRRQQIQKGSIIY